MLTKLNRITFFIGFLPVLMLMLSGCAFNTAKEEIKLSVWCSEKEQELMAKLVDSFEKEYASEASFEITICEESEATCKDTVLFCPEVAADIFFFADDQMQELIDNGAIEALTDEDAAKIADECGGWDSVAIEAASYDGRLYAYPSTASNGYFLYYNKSYFKPEDVESLDKIMDVTERNNKKFGIEMTSGWYMYSFFKGAGLDVYVNDDGVTNTCDWNERTGDIKGVDVANAILALTGREGFVNVSNDDFVEGIQDGTIIAGISGTWNAKIVQEAFKDGYTASKLPTYTVAGKQVQMHSVAGYKLLGVNPHSQNKEWARRLAMWLSSEDCQLLRFEEMGEGPANVKAAKSEEVQSDIAISALGKQNLYGHLQRVAAPYWDATYKFGNVLVAGNPEGKDIQEMLDELVEAVSGNN